MESRRAQRADFAGYHDPHKLFAYTYVGQPRGNRERGMRESTVEKHLHKKATAAGALVRKMVWPGHRGAPDRLVIWSGQDHIGFNVPPDIDFVELKAPGKKPDPHQEREHEKLRGMGCEVYTLDTIEKVDEYIAQRTR